MSEKATFGGGCFWCIESVFKNVEGVEDVISGYAGGVTEDPSYREVCSGKTGHAEVVQVQYNENVVSYEDLLDIFFTVHNPETKDREGPDIGSQYRSIVLYHSENQKNITRAKINELESEGSYDNIVTEIEPLENFYRAEEKHQDFFEKNPSSAYCKVNIPPKLSKAESKYSNLMKE